DEEIEPTLPTTPVMPAVAAVELFDQVVESELPSRGPNVAGEPLLERHVEPDLAPSWAGRSFDFSDLREESSADEQFVSEIEEPAWYADEQVDATTEISLDQSFDRFAGAPIGPASDAPLPPASSSLPTRGGSPMLPTRAAETPEPATFAAP